MIIFFINKSKIIKISIVIISATMIFSIAIYYYFFTPLFQLEYVEASLPCFAHKVTIVIDPGHGGRDPGAVVNNVLEKNINLKVAKEIKKSLSSESYRIILTREHDTNLVLKKGKQSYQRSSLINRINIGRQVNADYFISIHCNYSNQKNKCGVQTFYKKSNEESKALANYIQNQLMEVLSTNRIAEEGNYFILSNSNLPTVLVELGFLSNERDFSILTSDTGQSRMAAAIREAIINRILSIRGSFNSP
jgi:N-acetylmuramoyl-L-alanine amidase